MLMRFLHSTYGWGWPSNWGMKLSLKLFVSRLVGLWMPERWTCCPGSVDPMVPGSVDPMEQFVAVCGEV